jgi:hypothetical protein
VAVTHPVAIRNGICSYVVSQIDLNTPPGKVVFLTAASAVVASPTFANPSFGAPASGTATANAISDDTNAVGGTIAKAELRQGGATPVILCSVTATGGGGDIQMNSVVVSAGQTVKVSSLTYSGPP